MHGIIPFMFDCWAGPVVHLLLLKSSMFKYMQIFLVFFSVRTLLLAFLLFPCQNRTLARFDDCDPLNISA